MNKFRMNRLMSVIGIGLAFFSTSGACSTQLDLLSPIQNHFVEMSVEAERLHIYSARQWQDFWKRFSSLPAPNIDFSKNDVIVALMGNQGSSGFSIRILDVDKKTKGTRIRVLNCIPFSGGFGSDKNSYLAVITSPYDVKIIPKLAMPIKWVTIKGQSGKKLCT